MLAARVAVLALVALSAVVGAQPVPETPANETIQHEHPDAVAPSGDEAALRAWLEARLADRATRAPIEVSEAEYDRARGLLGEEYRALLGKYVDVEGEASYGRTGEALRTYTDRVEAFRRTYDDYRRARERGDEAEARALADQVDERATAVDRSGSRVVDRLETLSDETGTSTAPAREAVVSVVANVSRQRATVEGTDYVATELSASVAPSTVSFSAPGVVNGTLSTADGEPVGDRTVRLRLGGRPVTVTTGPDGGFSIPYRPVLVPLGERRVGVQFVPRAGSPYLGSNDAVAVVVEPVTADLSVDASVDRVAYGDDVPVSGRATVGSTGVPGLPVTVTVGEWTVGETRTGPDGRYALDGRLPAAVEAGDRSVRASVPLEGRAVAGAASETTLLVASTPTALTIANASSIGRTVRVDGRLTTAAGAPVPDQPVRVAAGEEAVVAVTNASGAFEARASVPADGEVPVVATFGGAGNLEGDAARTTVTVASADQPPSPPGRVERLLERLAALLGRSPLRPFGLLVAMAIVGLSVQRGLGRRRAAPGREPASVEPARPVEPVEPVGLDLGDARAADDPDAAVIAAYEAARRWLAGRLDVRGGRTHWEFYDDAREADVAGPVADALFRLTVAYEEAAFAPKAVSRDRALAVLDDAEALAAA